jgi:hypothetical protein
MKRHILQLLLLFFFSFSLAAAEDADGWTTFKSEHFIVYYKRAPENFIQDVSGRAEGYYNSIAGELGFNRYDFWLWDNRAKIYIHDDLENYQQSSRQPGWSAGSAVPKTKTIQTFLSATDFLDRILPHEIGHIIFREFVGFDNHRIPLWLDEGVASFQEKYKFSTSNKLVKNAIDNGSFIPLEELSGVDSMSIANSNSQSAQVFYAEAISAVGYLIDAFGSDEFVEFCQKLRDNDTFENAISSVYSFAGIKELNEAWQGYLEK